MGDVLNRFVSDDTLGRFLKVVGKKNFSDLSVSEKAMYDDIFSDVDSGINNPILNWSTVKYGIFMDWQKDKCYTLASISDDSVRWAFMAEFEDWYLSEQNKVGN